jgi:hypothetical protein
MQYPFYERQTELEFKILYNNVKFSGWQGWVHGLKTVKQGDIRGEIVNSGDTRTPLEITQTLGKSIFQ